MGGELDYLDEAPSPPPSRQAGALAALRGAVTLLTRCGRRLFLEQVGEALEHDAAQLLGVDDRHGAPV